MDTAEAVFEILLVLRFDARQMPAQRFTQIPWEHRDAVFPAFRIANGNLCQCKIDVFYPVRYLRNLVLMYRLPQAVFRYFSR